MKKSLVFIYIFMFIFLVSFVSAFSFSDFFNKITGQATLTCADSDGGKNYEIFGTAKDAFGISSDKCSLIDGKTLTEYYCSGVLKQSIKHICEDNCENGKCVSFQPQTCSDGTLINQCSTTKPKYCINSSFSSAPILVNNCSICGCPEDYSCGKEGGCEENTKDYCFDSDDGKNYLIKGECIDSFGIYKDACDFLKIEEWYCSEFEKKCVSEKITCRLLSSDFICGDGACVSEELCKDTCESLGHECGYWSICGRTVFCGSCDGEICKAGICGDEKKGDQIECKKEGEYVLKNFSLYSAEEFCCKNLTEVSINKNLGLCINCGDGICKSPEDKNNCVQDCEELNETEITCSDGTLINQCSTTKPKFCMKSSLSSELFLIDNCELCGCNEGYVCNTDGSCSSPPNKKLSSRYSEKEIFLISDKNWKDVLPFVSVAIWTEKTDKETAESFLLETKIKKFPMLIWHDGSYVYPSDPLLGEKNEEEDNEHLFDVDSIIYFMQQYNPDRITLIGETPETLDNILIAKPSLGAGLDEEQIQRIKPDDYLSYWENYNNIVYVEDNYELALLASTYASLINAPLIIEGSFVNISQVFFDKEIICVGDVSPPGGKCSKNYNLKELRKIYLDETNTDKIILINPKDLDIKVTDSLWPEKSPSRIYNLYTKTSLSSPILASAKYELILSTIEEDYDNLDFFLEEEIENLDINLNYLTIVAASNAIPIRKFIKKSRGFLLYRALDPTKYADFDSDSFPDVGIGRIQGMSSSDVSSYIARALFYETFYKTNNIRFMASSFDFMINRAKQWDKKFSDAGYDSVAFTSKETSHNFLSSIWASRDLIVYMDHGGEYWAGIFSNNIPFLDNSVVFTVACLTCSTYDEFSFCNNAIRKGALGYYGTIGVTGIISGDMSLYTTILNEIYKEDNSLGNALKEGYVHVKRDYQQLAFFGDPTLNLNLPYKLDESLS